jgi:uncharacterized integral membrane protein (TIGR00698 family)
MQQLSIGQLQVLAPGVMASFVIAIAATFLNEHYGAPAMLFALLLGLSFKFLSEEGPCGPGIVSASTSILRIGVALLGFRITTDQVIALGPSALLTIVVAVALIICVGLGLAKLFGLDWRLGLLTAGSVGICGAAAAMTISSLLPKGEDATRWTLFTVVGVTALSTIAMIGYPILASLLALDNHDTGFFLGATIHDVAQVMGAGYAVSDNAGDVAALTKMMRVAMLVPISFVITVVLSGASGGIARLHKSLPWFVGLFAIFAVLNNLVAVPLAATDLLSAASRWCLIIGIAAMGMRTSFKEVLAIGPRAIALLCIETIVLALFILTLVKLHAV